MTKDPRKTLLDEADRLAEEAASIVNKTGATRSVEDDANILLAAERAEAYRRAAKQLPKPPKSERSSISVREPDLFGPNGTHSWFQVMLAARSGVPVPGLAPPQANDLLERHARYEAGKRLKRSLMSQAQQRRFGVTSDRSGSVTASPSGRLEARDLSLALGSGGELSPPVWLLDRFASVARSAAPLLGAVTDVPLPDDCQTVYVPRATVVGSVEDMAEENVNPPVAWQATDEIACNVATVSGIIPLSQQFADRGPGIDGFLSSDFAANYAAKAESLLLNANGTGNDLVGILNVSTSATDGVPPANIVSYTAATPTTAGVIQSIGKAAATVGDNRLRAPSAVVMTPERYFWLAGYPDGSGNVSAMRAGTGGDLRGGDTKPWGPIASLPAYLDASLPQNLGTGANQDVIAVLRTKDVLWLQSEPSFDIVVDTSAGASGLTVFARYWVYVAAFTTRYPSAICTVQGAGLDRSNLGW